jgi:hypothetical protein
MPRIDINGTGTRQNRELRGAVDAVWEAQQAIDKLYRILSVVADAQDWSPVEQLFETPEGTGEAVYNLIAGARSQLTSGPVNQFIEWLG